MNSPLFAATSCITLLTDFGQRDAFVGQMKGVAIGINPHVRLIDLTHEIPAQNILRGAYVWNDAVWAFPAGTIHVGVVDPGVGSERFLIAAQIGGHYFICPDNGLLSVVLAEHPATRIIELDDRKWWRDTPSNTFHGRDILTPVAAYLSLGRDLLELGSERTSPPVALPLPVVTRGRTSITGQIVDIDRFGNLITNIDLSVVPVGAYSFRVEFGAFAIEGLSRCYADVDIGDAVALQGSHGRLEIAIRDASAAEEFQAECGRSIVVRWKGPTE